MEFIKKHQKKLAFVALVVIILLSFYARLKYIFNIDYILMTDALNYHNMTLQFLEKGFLGYMSDVPNAYITPGYPLFLAPIYALAGAEAGLFMSQIVQSVLGAVSGIVMYFICQDLFKKRWISVFCAALMACYPPFIMASMNLLTETLYNFVFVVYLLVQIKSIMREKSYWLAAFSGVMFAVCVLVRPSMFPLLILPYIIKIIKLRKISCLKEFLVFLGGIILVMLPWWIRNIVIMKEFILLCTQSGNPMLAGTFPYFEGMTEHVMTYPTESEEAVHRIINGFLTEPWLYFKWFTIEKFKLIFLNIWYYLPGANGAVSIPYFNDLCKIMHFGIIAAGWAGAVLGAFSKKMWFIVAFAVLITGAHLLFIPTERYAITIIPLLIVMAGYLISRFKLVKEEPNEA